MSEIIQQPLTKKGLNTKQKLLDTAMEVFGEKGYFESSIVEITLKAGVAQGTFYNYFATKKAIFDELVIQLSSNLRYHIKLAIDEKDSFIDKQRVGYKAFFQWVLSHRNLYSIVQQTVLVDKDLYRWYYEKLAQGFIHSIEAAVKQEECRALNPETIAYCLMGIGQFIGMRFSFWEESVVPEDVVEEIMEFIEHGLKL